MDTLKKTTLCVHILSRFGPDHDPVVIGEIRRPLSEVEVGNPLQCCDRLGEIETELEIETVSDYEEINSSQGSSTQQCLEPSF